MVGELPKRRDTPMNAKEELVGHIEGRKVAYVRVFDRVDETTVEGSLEEVLPKLDFEYDNGFGAQTLEGKIWYADGKWSDCDEYDGSEWWS